jgi:hypothetical protein
MPDDLEIQLSLVSLAMLKQITEVWLPLVGEKIISKQTFMTRLPGNITYEQEQELINEEAEDAAERSPFQNGALDTAMQNIKENGANQLPEEAEDGEEMQPGSLQNPKKTLSNKQGETK